MTVDGPPFSVPRYLHLDLGKQTQRNVARFRLHSHAVRVETRSWEHHDGTCDKCNSYRFISELMDVFCMAGVHQQPEQSSYLAEGQT